MTKVQKHPGMTNADFEELGRYVRWMANDMGLRDWWFDLKWDVPRREDGAEHMDAGASIKPIYGKKLALLWFSRDFRDEPPDRQRVWVCHELLHCHFDTIDTLTSNELQTHLGEIYYQAWYPAMKLAIEHCINAIAEEWGPKMPMIDWPTAREAKPKKKSKKRS